MKKSEFTARNVIDVPEGSGLYEIITDRYWMCLDDEGKEALFYTPKKDFLVNAPQCNPNEFIQKDMLNRKLYNFPVNIVFIKRAFIKRNPKEYEGI